MPTSKDNSPNHDATPALEAEQLKSLVATTVASYETRAEQFWQGTKDHDVEQNRQALLNALPPGQALNILDLGCGPGRDLRYFKRLGHQPIGLDACPTFCQMAQDFGECEVWQQDFLQLDLPNNRFHGIFANASLFHVPQQELPRVLTQLYDTLAPQGVLLSSNPRGTGMEGWNGQRYGAWHDFDQWHNFLVAADFQLIQHYYRPPGLPRDQQHWLVTLWRKP